MKQISVLQVMKHCDTSPLTSETHENLVVELLVRLSMTSWCTIGDALTIRLVNGHV